MKNIISILLCIGQILKYLQCAFQRDEKVKDVAISHTAYSLTMCA